LEINTVFDRTRLFFLMYGFGRVIWFAGIIDGDFRNRLKETPFTFLMKAADGGPVRYFQCIDGRLRTSRRPISLPADAPALEPFGLVWRDSKSGGQAMFAMLLGKPQALYQAVADGVLMLEGEGRMVFWFLKTVSKLNRVFRPKKKRGEKKEPETNTK
jgi:hypothetical protein